MEIISKYLMPVALMKLITHNGRFHYDEILSSAILLKLYPDAEIIRTRDNEVIEKGDIVYDVGAIFDPKTKRFDHHQATFAETFSPTYNIKLSSSGLIYKYFHKELLSLYGIESTTEIYDTIVDKVYSEFFLHADAIDNGYSIYGEIRPRNVTDLVGAFNSEDGGELGELQDRRFYEALGIVSRDLENYLNRIKVWANSYEYVEQKIRNTDGPIVILDKHYSPSLILEIESKYGKNFKFMVFPSNDVYKVIAIPRSKGSSETKNPLKKEWRGLRYEELSRVSGIQECIFVHSSGFMGINKTFENALKMCRDSLN